MFDESYWEPRFTAFLAQRLTQPDAAHAEGYIRRVVRNARAIAVGEGADLTVVLPAAWLHDCISVPADSLQAPLAATMSATTASAFLMGSGYSPFLIPAVAHAIIAHSPTSGVAPLTNEARVVQDATRLDALGAVGLARCLMQGGQRGLQLYEPSEPFPVQRTPDSTVAVLDYFYTKLLPLAATLTTATGRTEAEHRTAFLRAFLRQLGHELGTPAPE